MYQSLQRFLNKEHLPIITSQKNTKENFLLEHNKLSPLNLQATMILLSRFRIEKSKIFKNDDWSIDKLRKPFIFWLTSLSSKDKEDIKKQENKD